MIPFSVLSKQIIASNTKRMDILAPDIAQSARPGQFVLVMADPWARRLALPLVEAQAARGSITVVFQEDDPSAQSLGNLRIGQGLHALTGPLGNPQLPLKAGTSVCIGYEAGIASVVPVSRYLHKLGNRNFGILGASTKRNLIMESQMRLSAQSIFVMSEDGSTGKRGFVADALRDVLASYPVAQVFIAAPSRLVREVLPMVQKKKIALNMVLAPFALSGIGLCGTDRVRVGKELVSLSENGLIVDAGLIDLDHYDAQRERSYGRS